MLPQEYQTMNDFETNYWWYVGLHELILQFVEKKSRGRALRILDAGCGTGRMLELLQQHNAEGFDFSNEAIEICHSKQLDNVYRQNLNLWWPQSKFDVIISADVLCSEGIDNYEQILKNFYTGLNHDGKLILNLPAFEVLRRNHDKAVFVAKRFRLKELKKSLKNAGFQIDFISYRLPFLFFIIFMKKIYQKLFKIDEVESDLSDLPDFLNSFFLLVVRIENTLFKYKIFKFIGSSVFAVAKKI